jgi:hypothetical protein
MATVVGECASFLCHLLEAVQANEDPIVLFRNSCTGLQEVWLLWQFDNKRNPELYSVIYISYFLFMYFLVHNLLVYTTRVKIEKINNLFQVDIDRREQCCAANYEQYLLV